MIAPDDPHRSSQDKSPTTPANHDPVIFRYTRAQAIADGVLVDLTEWAKEVGFIVPVACSAAVWHQHIVPPPGTHQLGPSERGRAHDVLFVLFAAIRRLRGGGDQIRFHVVFTTGEDSSESVELKALCGPGDHGEPVVTVLLPPED